MSSIMNSVDKGDTDKIVSPSYKTQPLPQLGKVDNDINVEGEPVEDDTPIDEITTDEFSNVNDLSNDLCSDCQIKDIVGCNGCGIYIYGQLRATHEILVRRINKCH